MKYNDLNKISINIKFIVTGIVLENGKENILKFCSLICRTNGLGYLELVNNTIASKIYENYRFNIDEKERLADENRHRRFTEFDREKQIINSIKSDIKRKKDSKEIDKARTKAIYNQYTNENLGIKNIDPVIYDKIIAEKFDKVTELEKQYKKKYGS